MSRLGPSASHRGWTIHGLRRSWTMKGAVYDKRDQFDKIGNPLRTQEKARGYWFTPTGSHWWIKQRDTDYDDGKGNYYVPGHTFPVVPPRALWGTRGFRQYNGIPRQSMVSDNVPDDVLAAYHGSITTTGRPAHSPYTDEDRSERSTEQRRRARMVGIGDDVRGKPRKGVSVLWFGKRASS